MSFTALSPPKVPDISTLLLIKPAYIPIWFQWGFDYSHLCQYDIHFKCILQLGYSVIYWWKINFTLSFLPFLWHRMGRVCRLWNAAASSPILWRRVTISYCWITPGEIQSSKMEKRIKDTFNWLAQNRSVSLVLCCILVSAWIYTVCICKN